MDEEFEYNIQLRDISEQALANREVKEKKQNLIELVKQILNNQN